MATIRQMQQETVRTIHDAAEETTRTTSTTPDAAVEAARVGADLMQRNLEVAGQTWEASSQMARRAIEQSMGQFARTSGLSATQDDAASRRTTRGLEGMLHSAVAIAGGMQQITREWLDFSQRSLQRSVRGLDVLRKYRNGSEMLMLQTEVARDQLEDFVQSTRRMAECCLQGQPRTPRA